MTTRIAIFSLVFLISSVSVEAQDNGGMQTLAGNIHHSGGYGALLFKSSSFMDKPLVLAGGRGMWTIDRIIGLGFEVNGVIPVNTYEGMDPYGNNKACLIGGYGGFVIEPVAWSNKLVHVTFPVAGGAGWLGYIRDWESPNYQPDMNDLYNQDIFWYFEPGVSLEINITRFFSADIGATRRFAQDLELTNTNPYALNKTNFSLALKFGRF